MVKQERRRLLLSVVPEDDTDQLNTHMQESFADFLENRDSGEESKASKSNNTSNNDNSQESDSSSDDSMLMIMGNDADDDSIINLMPAHKRFFPSNIRRKTYLNGRENKLDGFEDYKLYISLLMMELKILLLPVYLRSLQNQQKPHQMNWSRNVRPSIGI